MSSRGVGQPVVGEIFLLLPALMECLQLGDGRVLQNERKRTIPFLEWVMNHDAWVCEDDEKFDH